MSYKFNSYVDRDDLSQSKKELEYLSNGVILPYVLKQICNEENTQNYDNI